MKKVILALGLVLVLVSCGTTVQEETVEVVDSTAVEVVEVDSPAVEVEVVDSTVVQ